jgi:hypothetical protein
MVIGFVCKMGMACRFWFSWYRHAFLDLVEHNFKCCNWESSYEVDELLVDLLKSKTQLVFTVYFLLYPYLDGII